jgi:hypothetical protein
MYLSVRSFRNHAVVLFWSKFAPKTGPPIAVVASITHVWLGVGKFQRMLLAQFT